jgi:hypothetical protein
VLRRGAPVDALLPHHRISDRHHHLRIVGELPSWKATARARSEVICRGLVPNQRRRREPPQRKAERVADGEAQHCGAKSVLENGEVQRHGMGVGKIRRPA